MLLDFEIENRVRLKNPGATPWVLDSRMVTKIISETRSALKELHTMVEPEFKGPMLEDGRWWSPAAYDGKQAASATLPSDLPGKFFEEIAVEVTRGLRDLAYEKDALVMQVDHLKRKLRQMERRHAAPSDSQT